MLDITTQKLAELKRHYLTYLKLVDAGLIVAVTPFADYLTAIEFDGDKTDKEALYRLAFIAKELE